MITWLLCWEPPQIQSQGESFSKPQTVESPGVISLYLHSYLNLNLDFCICICICIFILYINIVKFFIYLVLCFVDYAIGALPWIFQIQPGNTIRGWIRNSENFTEAEAECLTFIFNLICYLFLSPIFSIFWKLSMMAADLYSSISVPSGGGESILQASYVV